MIWTPRNPACPHCSARGNRRPRPPFARAYGMADGDISLDASGNRILDASGNMFLACCCGPYIQAKSCATGLDADLWFDYATVAPSMPFYFLLSGTTYYVNSGCNTSLTPGTIASGYTSATGCPGACARCLGAHAAKYVATVSGVSIIAACDDTHVGGRGQQVIGSVDGTYDLVFNDGCLAAVLIPTSTVKNVEYNSIRSCGGTVRSTAQYQLTVSLIAGCVSVITAAGQPNSPPALFAGAIPTSTDCTASMVVTNTLAGLPFDSPTVPACTGGAVVGAYGGTVTLDPA